MYRQTFTFLKSKGISPSWCEKINDDNYKYELTLIFPKIKHVVVTCKKSRRHGEFINQQKSLECILYVSL